MNYEEFNDLQNVVDESNPLVKGFKLPTGEIFFIEPAFYTQLSNFKELYNLEDHKRIIDLMLKLAKERKQVIYTYDYENPWFTKEGFIHLEFIDLADYLHIDIEDKSRGSDYGD